MVSVLGFLPESPVPGVNKAVRMCFAPCYERGPCLLPQAVTEMETESADMVGGTGSKTWLGYFVGLVLWSLSLLLLSSPSLSGFSPQVRAG